MENISSDKEIAEPMQTCPESPKKREAIITLLTTRDLALEALLGVETEWNTHSLGEEYEPLWCLEKVDKKGQRSEVKGRSARPMINVKDGEKENQRKNRERRKSGKSLRNSKHAKDDRDLVTYTKYLATHVVLYTYGRSIPRKGYHASHLCHNERCIRPSHLRVESELLNQQRKGCCGILICTRCNKKWQTCKHHEVFKCLRVTLFVCCDPEKLKKITVPNPKDEI